MADTLVERVTGQSAAVGPAVEIQLVMTDMALLGTVSSARRDTAEVDEPAQPHDYGPLPAPCGSRPGSRRCKGLATSRRHRAGNRCTGGDGVAASVLPSGPAPVPARARPGVPDAVVRCPDQAQRPRGGRRGRWGDNSPQRSGALRCVQSRQASRGLAGQTWPARRGRHGHDNHTDRTQLRQRAGTAVVEPGNRPRVTEPGCGQRGTVRRRAWQSSGRQTIRARQPAGARAGRVLGRRVSQRVR
jgi:hypothetical protein